MAKHAFAGYAIKVRRLREKEELPLDDFDGARADLLKEFYGFFLQLKERPHDVKSQEASIEAHAIDGKDRRLCVKLALGSYGKQSRIRNRETGEVLFQKEEEHVDLSDLRNYLILPEAADTGFLFTERLHGQGLRSVLESSFRKAFDAKYPGYTIEFNNVMSEAAYKTYLEQGEIKAIRLVRTSIPDDLAAVFEVEEEEMGTLETILRPRRNKSFRKNKIQDVLSGDRDVSSVLQWRDVQYSEVKVQVKVGGTMRTVSVSSGTTPAMLYDLDEELNKDGVELTDDWAYGKAAQYAEDLALSMGISADVMRRNFDWPSDWDHYRLEVPGESAD
ncbi:hypothetical protein HCC61_17205 [Streptomyces sp. HNM0575]|uniref:hypothetical protein n=1 Tax=Streptomyces sp. HNM0575 TaxID=2716338 RepID=UPI00145D7C56|nr:hypothetical protein [Streptomyces sp. HNM0575]NLU74397.1 hypothetical protein [Streptomyces sp. HNM0575]